jgi:hypothetical protein
MALPSSGEIKLSQINTELGRASNATIALDSAERNGYAIINQCSPSRPSGARPASMSEWYGYNHSASCAGLPQIYLGLESSVTSVVWKSRTACAGSLYNVPGTVNIYFTVVYIAGPHTLESDVLVSIPQNSNTSTVVALGGSYVSHTVLSYWITGADADLIICS